MVAREVLVGPHPHARPPREPESEHQHERHGMVGVCQVRGECGDKLLVLSHHASFEPAHGVEDVAVGVEEGDECRSQHHGNESERVRYHAAPVQPAHKSLRIPMGRVVEAQQRRATQHHGGDPREHNPTLASRLRLHRLVPATRGMLLMTVRSIT